MKSRQGFVYFVEEIGNDRVKIGFSTCPWKRLSGLKTSVSNELRLLWVFVGTRENEEYFHWLFQNHRVRGEWFVLSSVVEGFRHYGIDPDQFPKPEPDRIADVPAGPKRQAEVLIDPVVYRREDAFLVKNRKRREPRPRPKNVKKTCGGFKWGSEEYLACRAGQTLDEYREMRRKVRAEWEREHPGEVPYWRHEDRL